MQHPIKALIATGAIVANPAMAQDIDIAITNLTHDTYFTPLLVSAQASVVTPVSSPSMTA